MFNPPTRSSTPSSTTTKPQPFSAKVDGVRLLAQELAEVRRDALDDGINGINMSISSLDSVARKEIENQPAGPFIIISPFVQLFITLAQHQFVQCVLRWRVPSDGWLGNDDDGLAIFDHDAFEPDVVIKNPVLKGETVEIFGRGCAMSPRAQGDAISLLPVQPCCLEIALGPLLKEDLVLATSSEDRRQTSAKT